MKKIITLFPVLAGICWGSAGIFVRWLQAAGLDNLTIIFGRLTLTVVMVGAVMLITDRKLFYLNKKDIPIVAFTGVVGYSLMNIFYNYSIQYLSLSLAAVLLCTAPVYVIIFGAIVFKEKITPLKIVCMVAVLFGCLLMTGVIETGHLQWSIIGIVIGVLCSLSNAVCTLGGNEAAGVRGIHPLTLLFYNSLFALIPLIFFVDYGELTTFISGDPVRGVGIFMLNALIASLLPNLFFNYAFIYLESGVVSILASGAEPTAALVFGILIFSEIPTLPGFIGMVIVVGSIIILTNSKQEKQKITRGNNEQKDT